MLTIEQAISRLDNLIANYDSVIAKLCETMALEAQAIIIDRIQKYGITGRRYSANPLPVFFFEGRELNSPGAALLKRKDKRKEGVSYEEWRKANGLQTDHIDLSFSNRMWEKLVIVGTFKEGDVVKTIIAGGDQSTKDKLKWNTERFGEFLTLDESEETALKERFSKLYDEIIEMYLK